MIFWSLLSIPNIKEETRHEPYSLDLTIEWRLQIIKISSSLEKLKTLYNVCVYPRICTTKTRWKIKKKNTQERRLCRHRHVCHSTDTAKNGRKWPRRCIKTVLGTSNRKEGKDRQRGTFQNGKIALVHYGKVLKIGNHSHRILQLHRVRCSKKMKQDLERQLYE